MRPSGIGRFLSDQRAYLARHAQEVSYWPRLRDEYVMKVWDRATDRVNAAFAPADAALHGAVPEPHWYLDVIAVEPKRQGRGIGSTVLRAASARADTDGVPIVLLTHQPANLPLYRRHGYTVVCEGAAAGDSLPWWGLRRDPGT